MFATVSVDVGIQERYLTLPQAAISFNPYGELVYVITENGQDEKGKPVLTAKQVFVETGETRGDQITVLKGLKEGDRVVTSGQLRLKNGSHVAINNSIVPSDSPNPPAPDEH
jgi:membrane fusion protein (multidrug efflux system)